MTDFELFWLPKLQMEWMEQHVKAFPVADEARREQFLMGIRTAMPLAVVCESPIFSLPITAFFTAIAGLYAYIYLRRALRAEQAFFSAGITGESAARTSRKHAERIFDDESIGHETANSRSRSSFGSRRQARRCPLSGVLRGQYP